MASYLIALGLLVLLGKAIPPAMVPLMALPVVFLLFFIMAAGEEVGWMGYTFEPMQEKWNTLIASLVLGLIWAAWLDHDLPGVIQFSPWLVPSPRARQPLLSSVFVFSSTVTV